MKWLNKKESNEIPGKTKIYKTVEKYRRPGQTHLAKAFICVLPDTDKTGMVGVKIESFDGVPWLIAARLKDICILHKEKKLEVVNLALINNKICINYNEFKFTFFKEIIPYPNIRLIPRRYVDAIIDYMQTRME